jgi:hypothetical protein
MSPRGPVAQKRHYRENKEDNKKYLGSFPGEGCHTSEAKEGSDHRENEEHNREL